METVLIVGQTYRVKEFNGVKKVLKLDESIDDWVLTFNKTPEQVENRIARAKLKLHDSAYDAAVEDATKKTIDKNKKRKEQCRRVVSYKALGYKNREIAEFMLISKTQVSTLLTEGVAMDWEGEL